MNVCLLMITLSTFITFACNGMDQNIRAELSIPKINSFSDARAADALNNADKNTLVVFDVDDTLIVHKNRITYKALTDSTSEIAHNNHITDKAPTDSDLNWNIYLKHAEVIPIEPSIVGRIKELQKKSHVIALTHIYNGPDGIIEWCPEWRDNHLLKCGIDFQSGLVPESVKFDIDGTDKKPVFYNGILATDTVNKGTALAAFLAYCKQLKNWTPSRVIFFDDDVQNVLHVQQVLAQINIKFDGFHYCGQHHAQQHADDAIAKYQIRNFRVCKMWIPFEQAWETLYGSQDSESEDTPNRLSKWRRFLNKWRCCKSRQNNQITPMEPQHTEKN